MVSTALQSTPAATSELAIAAVNGMIGQAGQGKIVKVLNIDVREVNGEYIAVAMIQIDEPENEQNKDETPESKQAQEKIIGSKEDPDRFVSDPYYLHAHMSEAQRAIPDAGADIAPEQANDAQTPYVEETANQNREDRNVDTILEPETLTPAEEDLSEKVMTDFNEAEAVAAYNVDPREITAERLADKPLEDMNERELRALKAEVEQKLKETGPDPAPAADDSQTPGMAA